MKEASRFKPQLDTLLKGMFQPATLLDLVRNFIVFEKSKKEDAKTGLVQVQTVKILAAYHQYYAVNKAVESTVHASGDRGDKRGGVVWHTQGSGKSLSMVFYSGKLITSPAMRNPTIVVITDRNDLDDQLFDTFASSYVVVVPGAGPGREPRSPERVAPGGKWRHCLYNHPEISTRAKKIGVRPTFGSNQCGSHCR